MLSTVQLCAGAVAYGWVHVHVCVLSCLTLHQSSGIGCVWVCVWSIMSDSCARAVEDGGVRVCVSVCKLSHVLIFALEQWNLGVSVCVCACAHSAVSNSLW